MEGHVKAVAVLWIIYGALGLIFTFFLFAALFGISYIPDMGTEAPVILRTLAIGLCVFFGLLTLPELIAGFGIYNHREWGRIVGMAVAFLNLISFPVGTALSVYTLVILFHSDTVPLFKAE